MQVTKNPELRAKIFKSIRDTILTERSGYHLSNACFCTRKAYWRKIGLSPNPSDELCVLWLTGYAFQAFMFPADKEVSYLVDGVYCTPDVQRGIEVKTTRQSERKFNFYEMHHWHTQILGYNKALNQLEYDLVVMFVCGDYAPPFPTVDCWHIVSTQEEVDTNWTMVLERRDKFNAALANNEPPTPDCAEWECGYCESNSMCTDFPQALQALKKKELDKKTRS